MKWICATARCWGKILVFTFPLMLSGVLQLLFNAADIVVVGRFSGAHALAAVGSTSALINLLVNVFMGLSIGTNVLTAQGYGARNEEDVSDTVHTSILLSLVSGVILIVVGSSVFKTPAGTYGYTGRSSGTGSSLYEDLFHRHAGHDGI